MSIIFGGYAPDGAQGGGGMADHLVWILGEKYYCDWLKRKAFTYWFKVKS